MVTQNMIATLKEMVADSFGREWCMHRAEKPGKRAGDKDGDRIQRR